MQNTMSKPVVVGAAMLDDATHPTKMLAARRKAPKSLAGYWEFPGGKVEPDESNTAALIREIQEELGTDVEILDLIVAPDEAGWPLDNGMRMHVYTAVISAGEPQPLTEHDQLEWVALNSQELHELEWIPADLPILDALLTQLSDNKASA